jgi:exonuclease SbcD
MKFLHLGDLHIGKRVNEFPMIEDQRYIFDQILEIAEKEQVDGAILAGDIYDKALPSGESVELFDKLLTSLSEMGLQVYGISGNHDSAERIGYGSRIMAHRGVHLSKSYGGELESVELNDEYGPLCIYLLPFIKPATVRRYDEDIEIGSYEDAVKSVLRRSSVGRWTGQHRRIGFQRF